VLYADGDEEILNLQKEQWELVGDIALPGVRVLPYFVFYFFFSFFFSLPSYFTKRKKY
jgi:hypothetical protein